MKQIPSVVCLLGPTGTGKTAAAITLSRQVPVSVINFDSRQVYADFPLITAQPNEEEQSMCPHLLYGFLPTETKMTAARFVTLAMEKINEVWKAGRLPVLVGGTGMYLRSLLQGIAPIPPIPEEIRTAVLARVQSEGPQKLHEELLATDPDYAAKIHPNDAQRNSRAAEVFLATGKNMTWWHTNSEHIPAPCKALKIGIDISLKELEPHLAARIDSMLELGALQEAQVALAACPDPRAPGWTGIGCAELLAYLQKEISLETAQLEWIKHTRAYAKRQITWFKKETDINWFSLGEGEAVAEFALQWLDKSGVNFRR
ncbi:tRNA (adenosine(37)-N6)-dimethylallyltransferase MiaA [Pseudodesulfovibrio piezophilus]|uniref:tRNA dimethylallyltransferase n=1 Tax=Pseudodesulfovibrio piezophilus (strain DSM 21447 / JCM 15486 / C1TLV30) TaxID=1322246 RepID=M1WUM4_PSEP2|nr:tRNA (adenosine(37)-N6)-dimethylallyltransferase MiaA [Pseudodesulfovibrio piezophilus]CCH47593.1 tRNA dimethylallyltransferase [Pseudodesulfovibrio piezophilus C1TLV30]